MAHISGIVYDPPKTGFPYLAVIFKPDGEVLSARTVVSRESGEALISEVLVESAAQIGVPVKGEIG